MRRPGMGRLLWLLCLAVGGSRWWLRGAQGKTLRGRFSSAGGGAQLAARFQFHGRCPPRAAPTSLRARVGAAGPVCSVKRRPCPHSWAGWRALPGAPEPGAARGWSRAHTPARSLPRAGGALPEVWKSD